VTHKEIRPRSRVERGSRDGTGTAMPCPYNPVSASADVERAKVADNTANSNAGMTLKLGEDRLQDLSPAAK